MPKRRIQIHRPASSPELPDPRIRALARLVLDGERQNEGGAVSVVLVDDEAIKNLNVRFFRKRRATDVISFPLGDQDLWGEVYVSVDRTREQAAFYGVPPAQELGRCIVHGILHLTGARDESAPEKAEMRIREDRYLKRGGFLPAGRRRLRG
jgi:probable rRNA maturation factor